MSAITSQITAMKNDTAYVQNSQPRTTGMKNDSNMFLTLMLKQLENQDPTEPVDNTEWLAQLAQYSSLEQMTKMNSGLQQCAEYISAMYNDSLANAEINQTLSMIGKDVTLQIPNEADPKNPTTVSGTVTEASFESGSGQIKVNGNYYSIENVVSIRDKSAMETVESIAKNIL